MKCFNKSYLIVGIILLSVYGCSGSDEDESNPTPDPGKSCEGTKADVENISMFPESHPLNMSIESAKKDGRSDDVIAFITSGDPGLKADFGSGLYEGKPIGIPYVVVCKETAKVNVTFKGDDYDDNYGDQSDAGPYPIPLNAPIEGNGEDDSHVLAVDVDGKMLYELYNANINGSNWEASSGAVFDLTKTAFRPAGWTSADAAGLPIFPCLIRYDEVAKGEIDHAIRFTLPKAKVMKGYTYPASHLVDGGNKNSSTPTPFGMRLRLREDFVITGFSAPNQIILKAMKKHGIILADIGSSFYISGAPDERWNNDDLQNLKKVKGSDFIVVEIGAITTK